MIYNITRRLVAITSKKYNSEIQILNNIITNLKIASTFISSTCNESRSRVDKKVEIVRVIGSL